jgi:ABC-type polysaccharide/polyol phosphate transport system ATPase subunit
MPHIILDGVGVDFPLLHGEQRSLKRLLSLPGLKRTKLDLDSRDRAVLHALRDINLELIDGDRVGLVGNNGAGKSTLLRVIAGVYPPVSGRCVIEGRIGALLTVGLGMRDDVTGYDNIKFCLMLLGMPDSEITGKIEEIAEFTELGEYLSIHVGAYSAGMRTRLAFAIATAIEPDILVLDEVFGAGDASFVKKAERRMEALIARAPILVFASHSNELVERFCTKAIWLVNGEIREAGDAAAVLSCYKRAV